MRRLNVFWLASILLMGIAYYPAGGRTTSTIDTGRLKMYCWIGSEAAGRLGEKEFDAFFRTAAKINNLMIDNRPNKAIILQQIQDADIIYANSHSGYPSSGPLRMVLQTGTSPGPENELSAEDIQNLYRNASKLPTLVVINGCNTLADHPAGTVLKINEAFKIVEGTKGRAYLGFNQGIVGLRGDEYFRVFFAHWTRTPYPTLEEASIQARKFFENPPPGQKFLDKRAELIGRDLKIVGDKNLTFGDLLNKK
jgi:hypothetical protein